MRHLGTHWSAVVTDHNPSAVAGEEISIVVDGTQVGRYPISKRREINGMYAVRSDLSDDVGKRVIQLMTLGGNLKFVTAGSTYSVQLDGIAHAIVSMSECDAEAENLQLSNSQ